jgi:nucleoside-diphosphate-sugar epimerase
VLDVARLYRLAIEQCKPGTRYNAVAEEGITARAIAEALGEGLGIPVKSIDASESAAYFGWMSAFMSMDLSASSAWTRQALGWNPTGPTLLEDLRRMDYSVAA